MDEYFKLKITVASKVWYKNNLKTKEILFGFKNFGNVEKLWLIDKLHITFPRGPSFEYGLIGNKFLNKIYRNSLKKLSIDSRFTLFEELEILCKSSNLTNIELYTVVKDESNKLIPIEDVMALFPNLKEFE